MEYREFLTLTDEEVKQIVTDHILTRRVQQMAKVYNCSECDYCYTNETMGSEHICVNGKSDMFGQPVDWLGLAEDDMDCVVINGKDHGELVERDVESEQNMCDTNPFNDSRFGG